MSYTAILLAGSRPGRDDFAHQFGTDMKSLVTIGGEPMVRRPVRALLASRSVGQVLILSQAPDRIAAVAPKDARVQYAESRGTIAETMLALCDDPETGWPLLVTTADHALLTSKMVDEFCREAHGSDVAIGAVEKGGLLQRLPGTKRTWLKFRGGAYTGANLFALASPEVRPAIKLWREIEQDRKKPRRVVSRLGPIVLIAALLRMLTIDQVLARVGRRLGLSILAVRLSDPLAGVDVDTANDRDLVEAILAGKA